MCLRWGWGQDGGAAVMTKQQSQVPLRELALILLDTLNPLYIYSLQISHSLVLLFPLFCHFFPLCGVGIFNSMVSTQTSRAQLNKYSPNSGNVMDIHVQE